jgi:hypothetical protein
MHRAQEYVEGEMEQHMSGRSYALWLAGDRKAQTIAVWNLLQGGVEITRMFVFLPQGLRSWEYVDGNHGVPS